MGSGQVIKGVFSAHTECATSAVVSQCYHLTAGAFDPDHGFARTGEESGVRGGLNHRRSNGCKVAFFYGQIPYCRYRCKNNDQCEKTDYARSNPRETASNLVPNDRKQEDGSRDCQQNGGNGTQGQPNPPQLVPRTLPQTVSDEEIAQGYRFAYETNDIAHSFTMPANATYVGNAHIHGAASSFGRNLVDFGGWSFLFGPSNTRYSSAWWFIDGRVRFAPHDAGREISTGVSGSVLAMQGRSRIWHGPCDDGYAICWENVFLGGDTNAAANAQIIMKDNGWFEIWSNEVGRVYKRINQYDWDGDGLDNTIDSTPKAYDGNCFGTGIDWLNANCGAILSASLHASQLHATGQATSATWL